MKIKQRREEEDEQGDGTRRILNKGKFENVKQGDKIRKQNLQSNKRENERDGIRRMKHVRES